MGLMLVAFTLEPHADVSGLTFIAGVGEGVCECLEFFALLWPPLSLQELIELQCT